jgi:hypothetical protein
LPDEGTWGNIVQLPTELRFSDALGDAFSDLIQ